MKSKAWKVIGIAGLVVIAALSGGLVGGGAAIALIRTAYNGPTEASSPAQVFVDSAELGATMSLAVHFPLDYEPDGPSTYPVYWVLDGPTRGAEFNDVLTTLTRIDAASPGIVIEVPSSGNGRTADFTPEFMPTETGGHEQQFRRFLVNEALAMAQESMKANGEHILVGHSLGGLFALNVLTESPGAFEALVSISPSVWVSDQAILGKMRESQEHWASSRSRLYVSLGSIEGNEMRRGFDDLNEYLNTLQATGFGWKAETIEYADHGSAPRLSFPNALVWLDSQ
ncbi:MAG: alpha/beta hydrolase [Rhodothermales bacterium]|nr:alpha/beta hydrolase [Rhodothermales bacterium]